MENRLGKMEGYPQLLTEIKKRIRSAQYEALKKVNKELVALYWDIGRMIVERQAGETWGRGIVQQLAGDYNGSSLAWVVFRLLTSGG